MAGRHDGETSLTVLRANQAGDGTPVQWQHFLMVGNLSPIDNIQMIVLDRPWYMLDCSFHISISNLFNSTRVQRVRSLSPDVLSDNR